MSLLVAYLTVFVAAAIPWLEVLLVVPAGIVAGLPAVPTAVVGATGNAASLVPLVLVGDRVRGWYRARKQRHGRDDGQDPDRTAAATDDPVPAGEVDGAPDEVDGAGRDGRDGRARRLYDRFGLPGLALLGPLLTGVHVAALVGLAAGSPRRSTLWWLLGGVVLWSALAAIATVAGLEAFVDPDALPELFALAS